MPRGFGVALAAAAVVLVAGCGGDSGEKAEATKTITSEFPTDAGIEAGTPGSGGFIETPQAPKGSRERERIDELGKAAPEITRADGTGAAIFVGVHRDNYVRAKAVCGASPRRKLARDVGVTSTSPFAIAAAYSIRYPPRLWMAAFEGCVVGISKRDKR